VLRAVHPCHSDSAEVPADIKLDRLHLTLQAALGWTNVEMLEAINDPQHECYAEIREWIGDDFDPITLNPDQLKAKVATLAKRWSRKPPAKKLHVT